MQNERVTDEMVEAHAIEDANFAGTSFAVLGRADRARYLERSRRCLTAALAAEQTQQAVEVKKLEWRDVDGDQVNLVAIARTAFDSYFIERDPEGYVLKLGHIGLLPHPSLEAAKAAAQQDYETRIRSALVDVPAVESEPYRWIWEEDLIDTGVYTEQCDDEPPSQHPRIRNVRALYLALPRSTLAPAPAGEDVEVLRGFLDEAEEYVIDAITSAKEQVEMNEPYPTRAVRADAHLAELRDLHSRIRAALSRKGSDAQTVGGGMAAEGFETEAHVIGTTDWLDAALEAFVNRCRANGGYLPAVATLLRIKADELADRFPDDTNCGLSTRRAPLPSDADDMGDGAGGAKGGEHG